MTTTSLFHAPKEALRSFKDLFEAAAWELDASAIRALAEEDPIQARSLSVGLNQGVYPQFIATRPLWSLGIERDASPVEAQRLGTRWVETLDALIELGVDIPAARGFASWIPNALRERASLAQMHWLIDHKLFAGVELTREKKDFIGLYGSRGLLATLVADGPEEMALLERMVEVGLVGGADRCANPTDFAIAGQWNCARRLVDMGFAPGPSAPIHRSLDPIVAMVASFSPRGSWHDREKDKKTPVQERLEALKMSERLDKLVALGAKLDLSRQDQLEGNAFYALLGGGGYEAERAPTLAMIKALGPKLLAMGADPNAGGLLLSRCEGMRHQLHPYSGMATVEKAWEWAISIGAQPKLASAQLLSWAAYRREDAWCLAVVDRLVATGVDPKLVARVGPDAPVRSALAGERMALAWRLVELGAPLDYVDERGETALHMIAASSDKKKSAMLGKMLALPQMAKLVDAQSNGYSCEGERPLHRACSALSLESMRLLLEAGADANARDSKGWTPLRHLLRKFGAGAQKKIEPCLKMLLSHGADPSIGDNKGRTPAQAVAGKAPLAALEKLLSLRPEDVAGDGALAVKAKAAVGARGGRGRSLVEKIELGAVADEVAREQEGAAAAPAPKRKSRL